MTVDDIPVFRVHELLIYLEMIEKVEKDAFIAVVIEEFPEDELCDVCADG